MKAEKEIKAIHERNRRVEADKAWETSFARRALIAVGTYVLIGIFLTALALPNPWLNAFIPTIAYILSMLSLPFVKEWWIEKQYKK
ncbi:MAG: hypothetical protein V1847_03670 [Candidatus Diapherotrites archaeon]